MKIFNFMVDEDIIHSISLEEESDLGKKIIPVLKSEGLSIIDCNNYRQVIPGFKYKDDKFFNKDDNAFNYPLTPMIVDPESTFRVAFVVGNDVLATFTIEKDSEMDNREFEKLVAGFSSNPYCVEDNG